MIKNILKVLRGTVVAQAIGFLAMPMLTRVFDPEAFGMFQTYQSVLSLLLVTAAMRYEIAVLQAADGQELASNLQLCGLVHVASTLLTAVVVAVLMLLPGLVSETTTRWIWWLPVGMMLGGLVQTMSYITLRHKAFDAAAGAKVMQSLGYVGASLGIGAIAPFTGGLIVGDLVGRLLSVATLARHSELFSAAWRLRPTLPDLRKVAHKFREFPLVAVPGGLINAAGGAMTGALFYAAFDASTAGQYGLVERGLLMPLGMIGAAVAQVYTADLAACLRNDIANAVVLFRRLVSRMMTLSLLPSLVVAGFAPEIFVWVFGESWRQAGEFARLMAPWILVALATSAVNMTIMVLGRQRVQLSWEVARLVLVGVVWTFIGGMGLAPHAALALHVASNVAMNLIYLWMAHRCLVHHVELTRSASAATQAQ